MHMKADALGGRRARQAMDKKADELEADALSWRWTCWARDKEARQIRQAIIKEVGLHRLRGSQANYGGLESED